MNEIHGKSILVRVSARFDLAKVRVLGIRLYNNNGNNDIIIININQATKLTMTRSTSLFFKATAEVIEPRCEPSDVAEFLWRHLQRDLDVLGRALGRSVDDAALTVHLVLHRMISINGGETGITFFSAGCSFPVLYIREIIVIKFSSSAYLNWKVCLEKVLAVLI